MLQYYFHTTGAYSSTMMTNKLLLHWPKLETKLLVWEPCHSLWGDSFWLATHQQSIVLSAREILEPNGGIISIVESLRWKQFPTRQSPEHMWTHSKRICQQYYLFVPHLNSSQVSVVVRIEEAVGTCRGKTSRLADMPSLLRSPSSQMFKIYK